MGNQLKDYPYGFYIKGIGQKMRDTNDQILVTYGLNTSQGMLLGLINRAVEDGIQINRRFLETTMRLSGPSITNLLNGLEKNGFILRKNQAADGRNLQIEITPKGQQVIVDMYAIFETSEEQLLKGMSEAEKDIFLSLLARAFENVAEQPPS